MKNTWEKFTDRFGGTVFHPQYIFLSYSRAAYKKIIKYGKNKRLIDIGCGRMPYRKKMESVLGKYVSVDHPSVSKLYKSIYKPDIYADVCKHIPVKNNSFDLAVMFEVLEYLDDPLSAFLEINRLLTKGGKLVMTTPFLYPLHDIPHDRNRFSATQIESFLTKSGFKLKEVVAGGNFVSFWLLSLNVYLLKTIMDIVRLKKNIYRLAYLVFLLVITPFVVVANNLMFVVLKNVSLRLPNYFPLNFLVVAVKE